MGRPYSMDLRRRVVDAVEKEGLSRRAAAARFGVSYSIAIAWLKRFHETGSVEPGQTLAVEGTQGIGFFLIENGTARVTVDGHERRRLGPGDHFGEIALIVDSPRTATVTAETQVVCWGIASWAFRPIVQENASVAWRLLDTVAKMVAQR